MKELGSWRRGLIVMLMCLISVGALVLEKGTTNGVMTDLEAGTISFDAMKLKWDVTVWDLSEDDPVLR